MKTHLLIPGERRRHAAPPNADAKYAVVDGECPRCDASPFRVAGQGRRTSVDDRAWEANASCLDCGHSVGVLRVDVDTIFGVREDEAVGLRCRVYA